MTRQRDAKLPEPARASRWRPWFIPLTVELLVVALLAALFVPWGSLLSRERDDVPTSRSLAYALLSGDVSDSPWEIAVFDEDSGQVVTRIPTAHQPMVLPHPSGDGVFLVETHWDHAQQGRVSLSIMDTASWARHSTVTLEHAPLALALSPDGTRLIVRVTNLLGDYWLDAYDARTLERPSGVQRVDLPRACGAGRVLATADEMVLVCGGITEGNSNGVFSTPLTVFFVDPTTMQITASVPMDGGDIRRSGHVAGIAAGRDGASLYVVCSNLQMLEIDADTHEVVRIDRSFSTWDQEALHVVSGGEDALLVATRDTATVSTFVQLRRFSLPTMDEQPALMLRDGLRIASGADGTIYRWQPEGTDLTVHDLTNDSQRTIRLGSALPTIISIVRTADS